MAPLAADVTSLCNPTPDGYIGRCGNNTAGTLFGAELSAQAFLKKPVASRLVPSVGLKAQSKGQFSSPLTSLRL